MNIPLVLRRLAALLTTRRRGDGTTEIHLRVSDAAADRLMTTLSAFTSPRRESEERISHPQALGHAFVALLEGLAPDRLPLHGGDATSVMVTIDLTALRDSLGTALTDGGTRITASGQYRSLGIRTPPGLHRQDHPGRARGRFDAVGPRSQPPAVLTRPAQGDGSS